MALCPIKIGSQDDRSLEWLTKAALADLGLNTKSPFADVPNTYLARLFILRDVFYESKPGKEEHLKSQYLVFTSNFYGDRDTYLHHMWTNQEDAVRKVWKHCVGFDGVEDTRSFINYIERCQITNSLLFNGSTDQPLAEQLKGLYLKQRFGEFAANNQGLSAADLKAAFRAFLAEVELDNLARPTWAPGADTLDAVLVS
jgi:hypothetical protein